jgi:hypothetical protein
VAKRYITDLDAAELEQLRRDAQEPSSQRYVDRRLAGERPAAHEALGDVADRLLDYTGPEAAALLDDVEARIDRHGVRR